MSTDDEKLRSKFANAGGSPPISSIRFPHFKALEPDLQIDFTYPITALVGQNGSNKSSILHALYCAPGGNSMSNLWFSTRLDPIESTGNQHRFVYKYPITVKKNKYFAEVRKSRVSKKFRNDWVPQVLVDQNDPDYWEPTKRVSRDSMDPIPSEPDFDVYLSGTRDRWKALSKKVVYLDFRAELSAYDKFVYHAAPDRWTKNPTERRYRIITRSGVLAENFATMNDSTGRVTSLKKLPDATVKEVSQILGKNFAEIKLIRHRHYGVDGHSALMRINDLTYSEAHAGSGEFAVIRLVHEVDEAEENSLILLDEPEVSLHPGAQIAMVNYIKRQCINKGHQVVLSTHSPTIVHSLPPDAIKLLGTDGTGDGAVHLLSQSTLPHQAFFNLGYLVNQRERRVVVEDRFVEEIVRTAARTFDPTSLKAVQPVAFPGGADRIIQSVIPAFAVSNVTGTCILLDGDQLPLPKDSDAYPYEVTLPDWSKLDDLASNASTADEAKVLVERWRTLVTQYFGKNASFEIHGRDGDNLRSDLREISEIQRNLRWCRDNVRFLAGRVPEASLAFELDPDFDALTTTKPAKAHFRDLAHDELGKAPHETVTADEILGSQIRELVKLQKSSGQASPLLKSAAAAIAAALND